MSAFRPVILLVIILYVGFANAEQTQQLRIIPLSALDLEAVEKKTVHIVKGENVKLIIEGKAGAVYHLHGYDLIAQLNADNHSVIILYAEFTGRYPLVQHLHDGLLGKHEFTVAYVEVKSP